MPDQTTTTTDVDTPPLIEEPPDGALLDRVAAGVANDQRREVQFEPGWLRRQVEQCVASLEQLPPKIRRSL